MTAAVDGRVNNGSEHRDPSPTTSNYAARMARTNSADEVEPWDERPTQPAPAPSKGPLMACFEPEEELDDGDLPSLAQKPKMGGRLVGGQRTTTRPLSPPSTAGLAPEDNDEEGSTAQRQFWSQLDMSHDQSRSMYEEEGPDDELAADNKNKQHEQSQRPDEVEQYNIEPAESEDNFCSVTLRTIGTICGTPEDAAPSPKRRSVLPISKPTNEVDEQTAIEVEYVEPRRDKSRSMEIGVDDQAGSSDWSESRKNAYLAAMARKAKQDFERKTADGTAEKLPEEAPPSSSREAVVVEDGEDVENSDIYNSYSAKEKRKFLKFINSGMSPSESSRKIEEEREAQETKNSASPKKRFAFWRKTKSENLGKKGKNKKSERQGEAGKSSPTKSKSLSQLNNSAPRDVEIVETVQEEEALPKEEEEEEADETPRRDIITIAEEGDDDQDAALEEFAEEIEGGAVSRGTEAEQDPQQEASHSAGNRDLAIIGASAAIGAGAVGLALAAKSDSANDTPSTPDGGNEFERSGKSYYDSDRKEQVEEEGDEEEENAEAASPTKEAGNRLLPSPKSQRFQPLSENEAADGAPRRARSEKRSRSLSRGASQRSRGAALSPESTPGRRRLLGLSLPGAKPVGFRALQDEEPEEKKTESPTRVTNREATSMEDTLPSAEQGSPEAADRAVRSDNIDLIAEKSSRSDVSGLTRDTTLETSRKSAAQTAEEDLMKLERSLLRPVAADPNAEDDQVGYALPTPRSMASPQQNGNKIEVDNLDVVSLSTYLESTSQYDGGITTHDHISVVSGKSGWTAGTGLTGASSVYTHSSRKRRPGAAKERLAKAKAAESKARSTQGWHESMRAAASKTSKSWDPQDGFSGYKDPTEEVLEPKTDEPLKVTLPGRNGKKPDESAERSAEEYKPVKVPFPAKWARERDAMLDEHSQFSVPEEVPVVVATSDVVSQQDNETVATSTSSKPSGWVESMQAATANMGGKGPKWDAERGWVGIEKHMTAEPTATSGMQPPVARDVVDFDQEITSTQQRNGMLPRNLEESLAAVEQRSTVKPDRTMDDSTYASEQGTSLLGDKFLQLGDNGSVRSYEKGQTPRAGASKQPRSFSEAARVQRTEESQESDQAPLVAARDAFVNPSDVRAPEVQVVKQKCDEDDINLFASPEVTERRGKATKEAPPSSNRRGAGPVDLDEIDDMDFGDSDEEGSGWAKSTFEESSRASTGSKPPKLPANTKDTSPIAERKAAALAQKLREEAHAQELAVTPEAEIEAEMEDEYVPQEPETPSRSAPVIDAPGMKLRPETVDSPSVSSSVRLRARQWESRSPVPVEESVSPEPGRQERAAVGWPTEDEDTRRPTGPREEWKSFLSKKARAERAAAGKQERRDVKSRGLRYAGPGAKQEDDDDDSLFEFQADTSGPTMTDMAKDSGAGVELQRSQAQHEETGYISEVSESFPDISPIQTQDEDESIVEERVSDTGTDAEQSTFLKRLTACAAPILPRQFSQGDSGGSGSTMPMAHLAFLRTNPPPVGQGGQGAQKTSAAARGVPPGLCGRPDTIAEDEVETDTSNQRSPEMRSPASQEKSVTSRGSTRKNKSSKSPRSIGSEVRSSSSVASDEFGARTSYLDAIAMKAAVSKPKRNGSRGRSDRSTASSDVSSSSRKSEKWREVLDKRLASGGSSTKSTSELSASERYASKKVDEMMEAMSTHSTQHEGRETRVEEMMDSMSASSGSEPVGRRRPRPESRRSRGKTKQKTESARAAEELAAARVEAMMAAMTSNTLDEGEI